MCHSVHGGGGGGLASQHASQVTWQGVCIQGKVYIQGGCIHVGGGGGGWAEPPKHRLDTTAYGQQAGGLHPAGMHSCIVLNIASKALS